MNAKINLENAEVAVTKGDTPQESLLKGIETLGGISTFIEEGDKVFIKFNLNIPGGFPTNTNFDVLVAVIELCKKAKAERICLGSFPLKGVPVKRISNLLNLEDFFGRMGAELIFLDKSNLFDEKNFKNEQLNKIKTESFSIFDINNREYLVPKVILEADKLISVNQVNVNPIFKINTSLLNSFSIVSPKYQELGVNKTDESEYISLDQFKTNLISNIIDIFTIKKPDLVINDLFYILEGAGPFNYKDSNLKKTNLVVSGKNAVSVDLITLKLLNIETSDYELIKEAYKRNLGIIDLEKITVLGEVLNDIDVNIDLCISKLEDINVKNFRVNSGKYCSGCFKYAYHLLNFMKTNMVKDLKYNPNNVFLVGQNPPEPEYFENILLFGDCAINSTKNSDFRTIKKESKKNIIDDTKGKILKKKKSQKKPKTKFKTNKKILEIPGCPPDISNCIFIFMKYYKKSNMPNLSFFKEILETWFNPKDKKKLREMEVL
ncbi:MAG: DUF362 domain-containing protein [Candidatus Lokiarchaeota archaeon]|nr:DUF362 domain-containing protein [Candidatus Lokiarchaeota archaeon]